MGCHLLCTGGKVGNMKYLFQTEHLRIRRFEAEDAKQLYENHLEEEMKQWIPNESYESLEEAGGAVAFYQSCVDEGHLPYVLAVEHRETGELIGDIIEPGGCLKVAVLGAAARLGHQKIPDRIPVVDEDIPAHTGDQGHDQQKWDDPFHDLFHKIMLPFRV